MSPHRKDARGAQHDAGPRAAVLQEEKHGAFETKLMRINVGPVHPATHGVLRLVVDLDGERYVQWSPSVSAGEEAELKYTIDETADFDITVEGIEDEKLTLNA